LAGRELTRHRRQTRCSLTSTPQKREASGAILSCGSMVQPFEISCIEGDQNFLMILAS
jgi:hypothetical protein